MAFQSTVGGNSGLASAAGTTLRFEGDVALGNGNLGTNLAGNVQLDGLSFACYDGLTVGAVTLSTGSATLNSNGGNILIGSVDGGGRNLTISGGTGTGTTTVTGAVTNLGTGAGAALTVQSGVTGLVWFQDAVSGTRGSRPPAGRRACASTRT